MKVLGLDVGEKRIGVARADSDTRIAVPVGYVLADGSEWLKIARIAQMNNTNFFVLGLPRSNEGKETAQSLFVRNFAKTLTEKLPGAKVRFQDESLTSVMAEERLRARKKNYEKGEIDAEAAAIILQDFLEGLSRENTLTVAAETTTNLTKKEVDKVKLNTKKARHKMKKATKWITGIAIFAIIALVVTGGTMWYLDREAKKREYAEYLAKLAAEAEPEVFSFMIKPGETIFDVKKSLIEVGYSSSEVEEAFVADYDFDFLKERPEGASLEGYLYGETHEFYKSATVKEIIETFLKGMGEVITENNLEEKYAAHGLSLFEGITLASIVQKEAPSPEQPTVAQVFLSRLAYGIPLGSDVTVSYALDVVDPDRDTHSDNQSALTVNSCYNTRLYAGLPCGPISNPGLNALLAVAEPADSSYLYFLTGDDGLMYYSYTEAEHIRNIYSHCQDLCNVSL
ncbi:endolytic transglycosylase MltG [Candidatus Saccharibacteria bacterium]|nr:endolytic transglycosylase MltG [Candidatus Saccharibacteria bacterium]